MPGLFEIPDIELIREAGPNRSIVEMMRRLKDAMLEQQQTTNKLTKGLYWFTAAILFLAAVQLVLLFYQIFFLTL